MIDRRGTEEQDRAIGPLGKKHSECAMAGEPSPLLTRETTLFHSHRRHCRPYSAVRPASELSVSGPAHGHRHKYSTGTTKYKASNQHPACMWPPDPC